MTSLKYLLLLCLVVAFSCNVPDLPEMKKLTPKSERLYDQVLDELNADNIVYSYKGVNNSAGKKLYFKTIVKNIRNDYSEDEFEMINHKILKIFDESGFDFSTVDEYIFFLYGKSEPT